ncbi:MAG TPA: hypothetical protein PK926_02035 [Spirochaetota bacterium]|nr:hypothetical protein [Spirochaetota bacterium]HPI90427.1 hypothetical protein [Spirochaetota bacterium]HPR46553.1 hypothetical protein [Spirochaetota bacterium]
MTRGSEKHYIIILEIIFSGAGTLVFDIREYLNNRETCLEDSGLGMEELDFTLEEDIDHLLSDRFERLYTHDRYRYLDKNISILYPSLAYPGNQSLLLNADKIRYLLSFYPDKKDLLKIDRIILRPRFIEEGGVELASLYIRQKKVLVMYLIHPHLYTINSSRFSRFSEFITIDIDSIANSKITGKKISKGDDSPLYVHPLWYILATIPYGSRKGIDKFFIKRTLNSARQEVLNDISFFYSRHGY